MAGNPAFGRRIRKLREEKRRTDPSFSLRQFAKAIGVSATFLSKVETGQFDPPGAEKIKTMARLLDVDPHELLQLADKPDPELVEIVKDQPKEMAEFLRTAHSEKLTPEELTKLTEQLLRRRRRSR